MNFRCEDLDLNAFLSPAERALEAAIAANDVAEMNRLFDIIDAVEETTETKLAQAA